MKLPQRLDCQVETAAFAFGGSTKIRLDRVMPIRRVPNGSTYVRRIVVVLRGTLTADAAAGNLALGRNHSFDLIDSIMVRIPGRSWNVIELPALAGSKLQKALHALKGRRPPGDAITVPEAGIAFERAYEIPFYAPHGYEPDDWNMPLALLQYQSEIEIRYAATAVGCFGASMDSAGSVVATCTAFADLVERDEFRIPTFYSLQDLQLSGLQDQIPLSGRVVHMLIEPAENAAGLTDAVIAAAARTQVNVQIDGFDVTRTMLPSDLALDWNMSFAKSVDEELPTNVSGNSPWIPWLTPLQDASKVTHLPVAVGQPQFRVVGSEATPRLLSLSTELNLRDAVLKEVARSGVSVAPGFPAEPEKFMTIKTASKGAARPGTDVAARLPVRLHQQEAAA